MITIGFMGGIMSGETKVHPPTHYRSLDRLGPLFPPSNLLHKLTILSSLEVLLNKIGGQYHHTDLMATP